MEIAILYVICLVVVQAVWVPVEMHIKKRRKVMRLFFLIEKFRRFKRLRRKRAYIKRVGE